MFYIRKSTIIQLIWLHRKACKKETKLWDKEKLIKKACYLVDLIEDVLAAVESRKPAESLPLYHYKSEEYTPAEDTLVMIKKAFGKPRFLEIAFNSMEQYYKIGKIMLDTSFEKYGRGKD